MSGESESGWLIERGDSDTSAPKYWAAGQRDAGRMSAWTSNHMEAVRFARADDARNVAKRLFPGIEVRICEHGWDGSAPEPDYCFDPDDWEYTATWSERGTLVEDGGLGDFYAEPKVISTLIAGPDWYVADIPTEWTEDGDPDDFERRWFATRQEALDAVAAARPNEGAA